MTNPKGEMKVVTTRSGLAYEGPSIPTPLEKVVKRDTEEITNKEHSNYQGSTAHIQPPVVPISIPKLDVSKTQPKPNSLLTNKDKLFELAKVSLNENCSAMLLKKLPKKLGDPGRFFIPCNFSGIDVCHALADLGASINLMPLSIWKKLSLPELTPTRMTLELMDRSDFFLEEIEDFPNDESIPTGIENSFYDLEGDIIYLEKLLNDDPFQLPPMDLKQTEETKAKSSIEEPPKLELKELPSHLEYAFLEESDKLPVIRAKDLKDVEKETLIKVLKSHKREIAWKIYDIK
nr:reverse transcriptase domain-containing protein [Tanacetum cinerariifolium]